MKLPDGAWHLAHGIYAGIKHGVGIPPYAWPPRLEDYWPKTSATLALAIRETEVVQRIEAARLKAGTQP